MPYRKLNKEEKSITGQYLTSLRRSLERIDGRSFNHYSLKLSDYRLLKYLLSKAYIEKRYLPNMVEEIIIKGLAKDKSYQDYVENDLDVEIQHTTLMQFSHRQRTTTQTERQQGHSSCTAS